MRRAAAVLLAGLVLGAWAAPAARAGELGVGTVGEAPAAPASPSEPFETAVLFVNGRPITTSHLALLTAARYKELDRIREEIRRSGRWGPRDEAAWIAVRRGAWRRAIRTVVFGEVLRAEAEVIRRLGFDVSERMVEERWRQMLKDAGGPAELARAQGFSVAALKELARDELLADAYRHDLRERLARPTPEELRQYFSRNAESFSRPAATKARAVVIRRFFYDGKGGRTARAGAERRAREVLEQAVADPAAFAALAEKYSEDPASAAHGGSLGDEKKSFLVERGAYEPELDKALFAAGAAGGAAVLVAGPANYYVLQVLKQYEAGVPRLEEIEDEVLRRCYLERISQAEDRLFRDGYRKVLVRDQSGRRIGVEEFFAEPGEGRKRSLFDREEPEEPAEPAEPAKPSL